MITNTTIRDFIIRDTDENDAGLLFEFITEMARYEKSLDLLETSPERIKNTICNKKYGQAFIGEFKGDPVAYAVTNNIYSTYIGKAGIYLEDLFVLPKYRGNGFGKKMLEYIATLAIDGDFARFEWSCLDWNTPSINFYLSLGAKPQSQRTYYRLDGDTLIKNAGNFCK